MVICGPTATGKTRLALKLAKKYRAELVSADSRQVYQGMDIGTGKDLPKSCVFKPEPKIAVAGKDFKIGYYEVKGIKLWLLDIVKPDYLFNVADYQKCGLAVLTDIWSRGKLPILVGGTGFYIKSLTTGFETLEIKPDWELRKTLEKFSILDLQKKLQGIDQEKFNSLNQSDKQNPRRLIRAIEVSYSLKGKKPETKVGKINVLYLGLTQSLSKLYKKIDQRVELRLENGLENEIKNLLKMGFSWQNSALSRTLAYSQWRDYFEKTKSKAEIIQQWKYDEHAYARRQMTWFRKVFSQVGGYWFDKNQNSWQEKLENRLDSWYSKSDAKKD